MYKNVISFSSTFLFPVLVNRLSNQLVGIIFPFFLNATDLGVFGTITKVLRFPSRVISKNIYLVLAQHYKTNKSELDVKLFAKIFFYIFILSIIIYSCIYVIINNNYLSYFIVIPSLDYVYLYFISFVLIFSVSPFISIFGMLSKQHYLSYLYIIKIVLLVSSLLLNYNVVLSYSFALMLFYFIVILVLMKLMTAQGSGRTGRGHGQTAAG